MTDGNSQDNRPSLWENFMHYTIESCLCWKKDRRPIQKIVFRSSNPGSIQSRHTPGDVEAPFTTQSATQSGTPESDLKDHIRFHFSNHYDKWTNDRRFPWKVTFHALLIGLVTAQVSS